MTFDQLVRLIDSQDGPRVRLDSRRVQPGDCFIAIKGTQLDGHDFLAAAAAAGAKYLVAEKPFDCQQAQTTIVDDTAKAAAILAQAQHRYPASNLVNLAVTGTNGKSTVAFLVRSVFQTAGQKCGLIGTIIYDTGSAVTDASLTTPDCLTIAETQQRMVHSGVDYMVIEASSHALSQNRLAGIDFKAAAFTNLSGEHLDYHKTETNYLAAKMSLFEKLSPDAIAVLNKQSPHAEHIAKNTKARILWYAVDEPADISAHIESTDINGTVFVLKFNEPRATGHESRIRTPLIGMFNIGNHLAAAGLCIAAGLDIQTIAAGLSALESVPGRLEKLDLDGGFKVIVDYAHTDDALKNVLSTLRPLCKGKLRVVFGCGGDRDRTKRPRMAHVAEQLADYIVVTSDNPRTEDPEFIIGEITTGFAKPSADTIIVEPDRKKAIEIALQMADPDDIVLIAGKGHETYQIIGNQRIDFSDKVVAQQYLCGCV